MIAAREVAAGLFGAYRLAKLDDSGMVFFDRTAAGALRSFHAALVALPVFIMIELLTLRPEAIQVPFLRLVTIEAAAYVVRWTAYPVLMIQLSRLIGREAQLFGFISAYNWANVLAAALLLPFLLLRASNLVPVAAVEGLGYVVTLVLLSYQWFVTRTALEVGAAMAAGLVAADLVLSIFLTNLTRNLLYAGVPLSGP